MLIGVKKRFVFIANSKTGSTSIESVLLEHAEINRVGSPKRKHICWCDVRQEYAFLFDCPNYRPESFFIFGVVREPADWVRSWYNYRRFRKNGGISRDMSFVDFWKSDDWIKERGQLEKFTNEDGSCPFDLIIPLEKLAEALPVIIKELDVRNKVTSQKNVSKGGLKRSEVSVKLLEEINNHYADEYSFYQEWTRKYPTALSQSIDKIRSLRQEK